MQTPWRTNMHFYLKSTILSLLLLTGCATAPIDSEVTVANSAKIYQSFSVSTANIPAFLDPIITSNFSVAMASKGLQPTS
jgi:hypothetical protein